MHPLIVTFKFINELNPKDNPKYHAHVLRETLKSKGLVLTEEMGYGYNL